MLIDLLEPVGKQPEVVALRSYRANQTVEPPRPVVMVQHYEELGRKLSFQPADRTASCSEAQRHQELAGSSKSSKQELMSTSTGFVLRQPYTNSFTQDAHTIGFSQMSSSDNRYLSECSSMPRYRAVPQIVTTQVPQTVPE